MRAAVARLNASQAKATKEAEPQIDREQTLQDRFEARVQQNRQDMRKSQSMP